MRYMANADSVKYMGEVEMEKRGRGRPRKCVDKKTIDSLRHLADTGQTAPKSSAEIENLRKLIEGQNAKIDELNNKLTKNQEITRYGEIKSNVDLNRLDKTTILSADDVKRIEEQLEASVRELNGHRNVFLSLGDGDYNAFERKTGTRNQLKKRVIQAKRALANEAPPKITSTERDKLNREHQELSREIAPLVASERDQWDVKNQYGHFQDAIDAATAISTTYSKKIKRWQNIGKILDPTDKSLWDLNKLRSTYKN